MTRMSIEERIDELSYQSYSLVAQLITLLDKVEKRIMKDEELDIIPEQKKDLLYRYRDIVADMEDIAGILDTNSDKLKDLQSELKELDKRL